MPGKTDFKHIKTERELESFCNNAAGSSIIGFDTEFVSENRYQPELCLLQIATDDEFAIVDTLAMESVSVFWDLLVSGDHVTIAHAAREEFLFCYRAIGRAPKNLFDVQLASAFVGPDYPCSYRNLVSRTVGETIDKGETRTDWKRRPLSQRQIDYALQDVIYLKEIHSKLHQQLERTGRLEWYHSEINDWIDSMILTESKPQWRRVSGTASLNRASLAVAKELWIWRDSVAKHRNRSPRRILPDDLLIELAKRGSADPKRMKAIRGFQNRIGVKNLEPICDAIQHALELPKSQHPQKLPRSRETNLGLLGQLVTTALNIVCRNADIAPSLVGTAQDVRNLAASKLGLLKLKTPPALSTGWRAQVVGQVIERILDGQLVIRVADPKSETPLVIEEAASHQ